MAGEKSTLENIVGGIQALTNPTITTVIEFDTPSTVMFGSVLMVVLIIAIIVWAIARKMSHA